MTDEYSKDKSVLQDIYDSDKEHDPDVLLQELGIEFVNRFFMLYRTGRIHSLENEATKNAIEAFQGVVRKIEEIVDPVSLTSVGDSFYLNKTLIKVDFSAFENFRYLTELFSKIKIGGLTVRGLPPFEEVRSFLASLLKSGSDDQKPNWIGHISLPSIQIIQQGDVAETSGRLVSKDLLADPAYLLRLYFKTVLFIQDFIRSIEQGEATSASVLQRSIHELIDSMGEGTRALFSLATIRSKAEYLSYHSVNVTLLSLLIGREFGFSRRQLSDLGMAALLHDLGKIQVPKEILEKNATLNEQDWAQLKKSNTYSLLQLIRLRSFNESALRRMLVAYEHAMELDSDSPNRQPTLFAKIVAITHCYDAMTTPQSYRDALLPNEAFKLMKKEEGTKFDPVILRFFFSLLSRYPTGALVQLETKEIALVVDTPQMRRNASEPRIQIVYDTGGNKVKEKQVELAQQTGNRKIVKLLDASKYRINPLRYLFPRISV